MSEQKVRQVLARFAPILHQNLQNQFHSGGLVANSKRYNGNVGSEIELDSREVSQWDEHFEIYDSIRVMQTQGQLFVPAGERAIGPRYRVNLETVTQKPIMLFDTGRVNFFLRVYAYIGFSGVNPYNAFIAMDLYAEDLKGKWVLSQIAGTGGLGGKPVYEPFVVTGTSIWFNLSVEPGKNNSLRVEVNKPGVLMLKAELHNRETLDSLEIPDSPQIEFFFWQLHRLMKPYAWFSFRHALM